MRIGIIGDVHAEHVSLETALNHLKSRGADKLLCVGDIVDGMKERNGNIDACCDLLKEFGVLTVRGNHEREVLDNGLQDITDPATLRADTLDFLRALPKTVRLPTPLGDLLLCHGYGENDMLRFRPDEKEDVLAQAPELQALAADHRLRFVANGHSHMRMVRRFEGFTIINAGTLLPIHEPCFAELDLDAQKVTFFDFRGTDMVPAVPLPLP